KPSAEVMTGVQHLYKAVYAGGVSHEALELVHLRVSQVNGCSACVAAWYESPLFTGAERAALALAEAATRLSDRPGAVTDEIWAAAAEHYDERQLSEIGRASCRERVYLSV